MEDSVHITNLREVRKQAIEMVLMDQTVIVVVQRLVLLSSKNCSLSSGVTLWFFVFDSKPKDC
ncbi:hypothetical protein GYH30_006777 [Glycine max]|nr:hypothetical protein GYH30_006777 [Glycine max]